MENDTTKKLSTAELKQVIEAWIDQRPETTLKRQEEAEKKAITEKEKNYSIIIR